MATLATYLPGIDKPLVQLLFTVWKDTKEEALEALEALKPAEEGHPPGALIEFFAQETSLPDQYKIQAAAIPVTTGTWRTTRGFVMTQMLRPPLKKHRRRSRTEQAFCFGIPWRELPPAPGPTWPSLSKRTTTSPCILYAQAKNKI